MIKFQATDMHEQRYKVGILVCNPCVSLKEGGGIEMQETEIGRCFRKGGDDPVNGVTLPDHAERTNSPEAKGLLCLQRSNKGEGWPTHSVIIAVIFKP